MAEALLVAKLKATAGVTAIVAARIYPMFAPQGAALPFLIYETTMDQPVNHAGGTTGTRQIQIALTCFASTYTGAKALAAAVEAALSGWIDANGCVWLLESAHDEAGDMMQGRDVPEYFAVVQEYSVWE